MFRCRSFRAIHNEIGNEDSHVSIMWITRRSIPITSAKRGGRQVFDADSCASACVSFSQYLSRGDLSVREPFAPVVFAARSFQSSDSYSLAIRPKSSTPVYLPEGCYTATVTRSLASSALRGATSGLVRRAR